MNKAEQDARSDHCFDSDSEDVIIELGVGKNMVKAMRFWALATGFVEKKPEKKSELQVTGIGNLIFNDADGLDPYGENPATTWLVHWNLASRPDRLTVFWSLFNKARQRGLLPVLRSVFRCPVQKDHGRNRGADAE